jgi:hypothetical protein
VETKIHKLVKTNFSYLFNYSPHHENVYISGGILLSNRNLGIG